MGNEQCIVNVAVDQARYSRGTARLWKSLSPWNSTAAFMSWDMGLPRGSPRHQDHPYGFKPYAVAAARDAGHRYVLWLDSAIVLIKDPQKIFDAIRRDGYYFRANGWGCGQWMTDRSLEIMKLTRDEAMLMPDFVGSCMGFDLQNPAVAAWFDEWYRHATDGAFQGDWKNDRHQCSGDPRCLGHRHDQVIGSVLFNRAGFKFNEEDLFSYGSLDEIARNALRPTIVAVNSGCT